MIFTCLHNDTAKLGYVENKNVWIHVDLCNILWKILFVHMHIEIESDRGVIKRCIKDEFFSKKKMYAMKQGNFKLL